MNGEGININNEILQSLETRAEYDPLTETYNRTAADANIREYFKVHPDDKAAVVLIEIDDIKDINSKHGHHIGDVILKSAARLIERYLGIDSLIGRNSGAEFIILLKERDDTEVESVVTKISEARRIVEYDGQVYEYSFSIGYAIYPEQGILLHDLAAKAYSAMKKAEANGGGCYKYQ